MKIICAPNSFPFPGESEALEVVLFGTSDRPERGSAGFAIKQHILREKLAIAPRAWDFVSIALSAFTADIAVHRDQSPDGWTRDLELQIAVSEPEFWTSRAKAIENVLAFLTTDRWRVTFMAGGDRLILPPGVTGAGSSSEHSVVLLSGGLDSLIGTIDLVHSGRKPLAVSQLVRGDRENQSAFAAKLGPLRHLLLNHNAGVPDSQDSPSQRSRSLVFIAYGAAAATTLDTYTAGNPVTLFICENGFISINPPLSGARIGALSTRTAHPVFLGYVQRLLNDAGLRVTLANPYSHKTKGEMLKDCADQALLRDLASSSTSCARYLRHGHKHCGRCIPCQIRRAAFLAWGVEDTTTYVFEELGKDDAEHAGFDDVRSAAMAIAEAKEVGVNDWAASSLSTALLGDVRALTSVVERGLAELESLHAQYKVK